MGSTYYDIYINWNAHGFEKQNIGTHRNLIKGAKIICSNELLLKKEMKHPPKVFSEVNDYPVSIIDKIK